MFLGNSKFLAGRGKIARAFGENLPKPWTLEDKVVVAICAYLLIALLLPDCCLLES